MQKVIVAVIASISAHSFSLDEGFVAAVDGEILECATIETHLAVKAYTYSRLALYKYRV